MTEVDESAPFAALLRRYRAESELTQEALAEEAGMSPRSIQKLERGESLPFPVTVQRLARALRLNAEERAQFRAASVRNVRQSGDRTSPLAEPGPGTTEPTRGTVTYLQLAVDRPLGEEVARAGAEIPGIAPVVEAFTRAAERFGGTLLAAGSEPVRRTTTFAGAGDALAAAADVQRTLLAERAGDADPLAVSLAVHSDAAMARTEGATGDLAFQQVTRLAAAAQHGQVLVSPVTVDVAGDQLPAGLQLRALGPKRLGDLAPPEHVFELVATERPLSFPPLHMAPSLDTHYEAVSRAITDGRVVLFLGEQVNVCGRSAGLRWQPGSDSTLPTGDEMAAHLAQHFGYPEVAPQDLVRVAQYASVMAGVGPLYDALHSLFDVDYRPNPVHELLASLPALLRTRSAPVAYPLIVTTCYDDTLERAFAAAGEPVDVVVYAAEGELRGKFWHQSPDGRARLIDKPNKYLGILLDERTAILKIHGAVDRADAEQDSFVITEDDYLDYLARADISNLVPVTLAARLRKSHYLFLGYSLRDWNLRLILRRLWGEQRLTYKSWAAQVTPDALDQEFWRKHDVDLLPVRLDDYVAQLRERFLALAPEVSGASPAQP